MADEFTEVESRSWFSRLSDSFKSVLFGLLLMILAPWLLFWNEGRAVDEAAGIQEARGAVVAARPDPVDPANESKLVHVTGEARTGEALSDPEFGVSAQALTMKRNVEMYQWVESKHTESRKKLGGGEEKVTEYKYRKEWSDEPHESARFRHPEGHTNPAMPWRSATFASTSATLGGFTLPKVVLQDLRAKEPVRLTDEATGKVGASLQGRVQVVDGGFYAGSSPSAPRVGDLKVTFAIFRPQVISVMARQAGRSFEQFRPGRGSAICWVEAGSVGPQEMLKQAESVNAAVTWALRVFGFLLLWIAISMVFSPLVTFADVIPLFGSILGAGVGFFSFVVAGIIALVVIAFAWFAYRPLMSVLLLGAGLALFVLGRSRGAARRA
jgi:hypothetical protein